MQFTKFKFKCIACNYPFYQRLDIIHIIHKHIHTHINTYIDTHIIYMYIEKKQ